MITGERSPNSDLSIVYRRPNPQAVLATAPHRPLEESTQSAPIGDRDFAHENTFQKLLDNHFCLPTVR